LVAGQVDIHILKDNAAGVLPSPVSAVIATRLKPGAEAAYQAWERKMAAAQASAKGFQGYRFEPPIPGVQDSWLAILRFDSEASLQAWMDSPTRLALVKEAEAFTEEFHTRIVRTGFDQWFKVADGASKPATWKMNMLVLMNLYPVVFVFTTLISTPFMTNKGMPFWLTLFIGNIVSVNLLNWLVPRSASALGWWLAPKVPSTARINLIGAGIVVAIYAVLLLVFAWASGWW
jgi:antibiotic biosynthesis monooxygenase (ABM) superfamily enzyme